MDSPPFVGALLRLCWQQVRDHLHEAIRQQGFTDLQEAHFAVFSYPLPDGIKPADLARQIHMSRQATNYLLGQLEALGYLERRPTPKGGRRLVYLTDRGWRVADTIYAASRQWQAQWTDQVGHDQFRVFLEVLRHLAAPRVPAQVARASEQDTSESFTVQTP